MIYFLGILVLLIFIGLPIAFIIWDIFKSKPQPNSLEKYYKKTDKENAVLLILQYFFSLFEDDKEEKTKKKK
jgi:hypothetical protein